MSDEANPTATTIAASRPWWFALGLVLLCLMVPFWEGLTGQASIEAAGRSTYQDALYPMPPGPQPTLPPDASAEWIHQPWDHQIALAFGEGTVPLWVPDAGCGIPLLANGQSAPLNPLKAFLLFGTYGPPVAWFLVGRLLVAGAGVLLLARHLGMGPAGAALAALAFCFNGTFMHHFQLADTHVWVLFPWLLMAGERVRERPDRRNAAVFGGLIGLAAFLGHAESAVFAAGAAVAVAAWPKGHGQLANWRALGLAIGLGTLIAGAMVLPFLELVRQADSYLFHRATGVAVWADSSWEFSFTLKAMVRHMFAIAALPSPYEYNTWMGAVALALIPFGLFNPTARQLGLKLLVVGLVVLATCPPTRLVAWPPVAPNSFYVSPVFAMGLAILAGSGLDWLADAPARLRWRAVAVAVVLLTVSVVVQLRMGGVAPSLEPDQMWAFIAAIAVFAVGLTAATWCRAPRGVAWAAVLLAAVELGVGARTLVYPLPRFEPANTPVIQYLHAHPGERVATLGTMMPGSANLWYDVPSYELVEAFLSRRYLAFYAAMNPKTSEIPHALYVVDHRFVPELLDVAAVAYVASATGDAYDKIRTAIAARPDRFQPVVAYNGITLLANRQALARARIVYSATFVPPGDAGQRALVNQPARWRDQVLVETPEGQAPAGWQDAPLPSHAVTSFRAHFNTVEVQATAKRPGWLVVADNFDPGWHAEVDGMAAEILPAYLTFRAVFLPAGPHKVRMVYDPPGFRWGAASTLLGLLLMLLFSRRTSQAGRRA